MLFSFRNKLKKEEQNVGGDKSKQDIYVKDELYPIEYSVDYLKTRTEHLIKEESNTTSEIKRIEEAFH